VNYLIAYFGGGFLGGGERQYLFCRISWSRSRRIFSVMTLVLPEAGPARTSWNPQVVTASSCERLSRIQIVWLAGGRKNMAERQRISPAHSISLFWIVEMRS